MVRHHDIKCQASGPEKKNTLTHKVCGVFACYDNSLYYRGNSISVGEGTRAIAHSHNVLLCLLCRGDIICLAYKNLQIKGGQK